MHLTLPVVIYLSQGEGSGEGEAVRGRRSDFQMADDGKGVVLCLHSAREGSSRWSVGDCPCMPVTNSNLLCFQLRSYQLLYYFLSGGGVRGGGGRSGF